MAYTPPPSEPTANLAIKVFLAILFTIVFVLSLSLAIVTFYYVPQEKKLLQDLAEQQVRNFSELEQTYGAILTAIKETAPSPKTGETNLLGARTIKEATKSVEKPTQNRIEIKPEVLGLEESFEITQARKLTELYEQAKKTVREIADLNTKVKYKSEFSYVYFTLPNSGTLTAQTERFADGTLSLLTYLEESNKLGIELFTLGYEFGLALNDAILRGADETAIKNLNSKISDIDKMKRKYISLDTSKLPGDLKAQHNNNLQEFDKTKQVLNRLTTSLRNRDVEDLVKNMQSLLMEAAATSESDLVKTVSFWQNNETIRAVQNLKNEWREYSNRL